MKNELELVLIDSAIEYAKNILLTNERDGVVINDLRDNINKMFSEFRNDDITKTIKNKCKKEYSKRIIEYLDSIGDCRCNSLIMLITILSTEETRLNKLFIGDLDKETMLMLYSVLLRFKNISQFIMYIDSSYIQLNK